MIWLYPFHCDVTGGIWDAVTDASFSLPPLSVSDRPACNRTAAAFLGYRVPTGNGGQVVVTGHPQGDELRSSKLRSQQVLLGRELSELSLEWDWQSDLVLGNVLYRRLDKQVGENLSRTEYSLKNTQKDEWLW